jgi:hypothetical protein
MAPKPTKEKKKAKVGKKGKKGKKSKEPDLNAEVTLYFSTTSHRSLCTPIRPGGS